MKKDNHYLGWGITAVAVVCSILLFYDIVFRDSKLLYYASSLIAILQPIIYGSFAAYLLAPMVLLMWLVSSNTRTRQSSAAISIMAAIVVGFLNKNERLTFGKIIEALEAGAQSVKPPYEVPLDSHPLRLTLRVAFVKGPSGEELEFFKTVVKTI